MTSSCNCPLSRLSLSFSNLVGCNFSWLFLKTSESFPVAWWEANKKVAEREKCYKIVLGMCYLLLTAYLSVKKNFQHGRCRLSHVIGVLWIVATYKAKPTLVQGLDVSLIQNILPLYPDHWIFHLILSHHKPTIIDSQCAAIVIVLYYHLGDPGSNPHCAMELVGWLQASHTL